MSERSQESSREPEPAGRYSAPASPVAGRLSRLWPALVVVLLFAAYPGALVLPVSGPVPLLFHLALPTRFWLSLAALVWVLLTPARGMRPLLRTGDRWWSGRTCAQDLRAGAQPVVLICVLTILGACLFGGLVGRTRQLEDVVTAAGLFAVPVFFATCPRRMIPRRLPGALALLWLAQVCHGLWQLSVRFEMVGTAGNRNWAAALIASLLPWTWLIGARLCRRMPRRARKRSTRLGIVVTTGLTLFLLVHARSRGTWLVLLSYLLAWQAWPRVPRRARVTVFLALAAAAALGIAACRTRLGRTLRADIRPPLWRQTVRMVLDRPMLGVGAGNFTREFSLYRSRDHLARPNAADVTEHPHNEVLNIAATLGIPLALAWLALLLPLLLPPPRSHPFWRSAHFSAWVLVGCAMLDKTWVQPPTGLLGPVFVGLLWRPRVRTRTRSGSRPATLRLLVAPVAACTVLCALLVGLRTWRMGWLFREAYLCESGQDHLGAYQAFEHATRVQPGNVRAHLFAGISANNSRQGELALPHLGQAHELDPNFAHVNLEMGLALSQLEHHAAALPFLRRETELHPYRRPGYLFLYQALLGAERCDEARGVRRRLGELGEHRLSQRRGEEWLHGCAEAWLTAVRRGTPGTAFACARALTADLNGSPRYRTAEPAFAGLAEQAGVGPGLCCEDFGPVDFDYWRLAVRRCDAVEGFRGKPLESLFHAVRHPSGTRQHTPAARDAIGDDATGNGARRFALLACRLGYEGVLLVDAAGADLGVVCLHDGTDAWLAAPAKGAFLRGVTAADLLGDAELLAALGMNRDRLHGVGLALPVHPLAFCSRTQVLAQMLAAALGPASPLLDQSPTLRRQTWRDLGGASASADGIDLPVGFDLGAFALPRTSPKPRHGPPGD